MDTSVAFYNCNNLTITKQIFGPNNAEFAIIIDNKNGKCGLKNASGNWVIPLGSHKWLEPLGDNFLKVKDVINGYYKYVRFYTSVH